MSSAEQSRARFNKRLAIIVPYRDRADHLSRFIPHMLNYFARDKLDKAIKYSIHVVEQANNLPFNKGYLCNAGYILARKDTDYICLHDVDYLPIWTDYSWPDHPTHMIWHGLPAYTRYPTFFGAVTLFSNTDFEKINGFSNQYWGWGSEDDELRERAWQAGLSVERRRGTYEALPHPSNGYNDDGSMKESGLQNRQKKLARFEKLQQIYRTDGLNSLNFSLIAQNRFRLNDTVLDHVYHYRIDFPRPEGE